jgi:hypothetical protein
MSTIDTLRHATLDDMISTLRSQQARKIDLVMPASAMRFRDGNLVVKGLDWILDDNGATDPNGVYTPTKRADQTLSDRLNVPGAYLTRMRNERPDVYDFTLNRLAGGVRKADGTIVYEADGRDFLARLFRGDDGQGGVLRAMLSNRYGIQDNLDVLMAVLAGINAASAEREAQGLEALDVQVRDCDLTDSRMNVSLYSPQVKAMAPNLLRAYRNPFQVNPEFAQARGGDAEVEHWRRIAEREGMAYERGQEPVVFAGFRIRNSEVGDGARCLTPDIWVRICKNGLTLPLFADCKAHLGARMEAGVWNAEVQTKETELIVAQVKQRVSEWLNPTFLADRINEIEALAGKPVTEPTKKIKALGKTLKWSDAEADGILAHFTTGGQLTAAGVANAITSFSQTLTNADRASDLDDQAVKAMSLV